MKQTIDNDRIAAFCDCESKLSMTGAVAFRLQSDDPIQTLTRVCGTSVVVTRAIMVLCA
jgi:hypothetical protein